MKVRIFVARQSPCPGALRSGENACTVPNPGDRHRRAVPLALQPVVLNLAFLSSHSKDREILKDLIITATEAGAVDVASETVKPLRYPCVNNDVNVIFVPENADAFATFSWTLTFRLVPAVKIVSLNTKPIQRTALQRGPLELLRKNHGRELFRRGGLIFVDGAYLIENLSCNMLGRLHAALLRYNSLVEGEQWTLLFRDGELKVSAPQATGGLVVPGWWRAR